MFHHLLSFQLTGTNIYKRPLDVLCICGFKLETLTKGDKVIDL